MRSIAFVAVLVIIGAMAVLTLRIRPDGDAARRRAAAVRAIGIADLCLQSDARWLRHPSLSEPGAAFHDLPGGLDSYPAGMVVAPPRYLFVSSPGTSGEIRRR